MIGVRRSALLRCHCRRRHNNGNHERLQRFSTQEKSEEVAVVEQTDKSSLLEGSDTLSLGTIQRHGTGDAVITLNVGGKEFTTLRSTVNSNSVLADHVARAETNKELTKTGAVFIDRDPAHFDIILKHIRNRVEVLPTTSSSMNWMSFTQQNLLPAKADDTFLREMYIEATYYKIPELQQALTEKNFLAKLCRMAGITRNPFDAVRQFIEQLRRWLVIIPTLSVAGVTVAVQNDVDAFLKAIGWRNSDDDLEKDDPKLAPAS